MRKANKKVIKIYSETPDFYTVGPFMTTSHRLAPIYIDGRKVFSDVKFLKTISKEILKLAKREGIEFDIIIGGATAGIQLSTTCSLISKIPNGYVRKEPKGGGLCRAVEGNWRPGMKALLIDDAAAHGESKSKFVKNIREAGMEVSAVIVPCSRNSRSESDRAWIKETGVRFYDFCDIGDIINYSLKKNIITRDAHTLLTWFSEDPANWNNDPEKMAFFEQYKKREKRDSISGV